MSCSWRRSCLATDSPASRQSRASACNEKSIGSKLSSPEPIGNEAAANIVICSLLPIMTLCFCFQLMDKLALSYTSILGIREDLHLSDRDYSWANSIYYFGYLAASYPAAVLMVRWPVAKLIAGSL